MKVLFLDFDGVLNSTNFLHANVATINEAHEKAKLARDTVGWSPHMFREVQALHFCPDMIARLNKILDKSGARVVLSTNWASTIEVDELVEILKLRGFTGQVIDKICSRKAMEDRKQGILDWLSGWPVVKEWVILEDDHPMGAMEEHTVRTRETIGLTDEHVPQALAILGISTCVSL